VQALSISALFGMAVLTGNHDLVIQAMEILTTFDKACQSDDYSKGVFDKCSVQLTHYLQQIRQTFENDTERARFHYMSQQNLMGVFGIAQPDVQTVLVGEKHPPQVTSDGNGYLYISVRCEEKTQTQTKVFTKIFKLGSGENGTVPGKIY
jgi:hypothetical protein